MNAGRIVVLMCVLAGAARTAQAQDASQKGTAEHDPVFEIYGFAQADAIADFKQNDPDWYDVNRASKLPSFANQFGRDGHFYLSARQSRFGVQTDAPADSGRVKAQFELDMFGVGADAGQTTIRLRHAWGQWKQVGAGQTNSQFMDGDVFPNILDYWGPIGMLYFRNVQLFWRPIDGDRRVTVAIENPGASGDAGIYADRVELDDVRLRFPMPDITAEFRTTHRFGYVKLSGVVRRIGYDDTHGGPIDLSGHVTGWGINVSGSVRPSKRDVLHLQYVYGHGIENYFNDAPVDVGVRSDPSDVTRPIAGEALPIQGIVVFLDHVWSGTWSSAAGYSRVDIRNSNGQTADAYKAGEYALVNLLATPASHVTIGGELQWAHRRNNADGFAVGDVRLECSFRYSFSSRRP
ncbi:MAG TPA: DcaP family trimeric outer membrane transporter [Vicinamibacterales bacterium]|nr:DcaP family trimeric outer membrane transporter [Vicinamibacterales bacterium]